MIKRYALRDDQWERIKHLLPGQKGWVGCSAQDKRVFVEAVLYRYRAGIPWRDLPERFGDWKNTHRRWSRWAQTGVWQKIFTCLASSADNEYGMIDSRIAHAHQHSAGAIRMKTRLLGGATRRVKYKDSCNGRRFGQPGKFYADGWPKA